MRKEKNSISMEILMDQGSEMDGHIEVYKRDRKKFHINFI